jgi:cobalt-precorrin 5A hydrolase
VENVCERAAVLSGGELLIKKQAGGGMTVAASASPYAVYFKEETAWQEN